MIQQLAPHLAERVLVHLSVPHHNARFGRHFTDFFSGSFDVLYLVVQVKDLSSATQLAVNRLGDHAVVVVDDVGLDRVSVLRRLVEGGNVPQPAHGHVQRARNGRRGKRENIHRRVFLFEFFLLRHTESLLLVDDGKS